MPVLLGLLLVVFTKLSNGMNITEIDSENGFYSLQLGPVFFENREWTLLTYIDIHMIGNETNLLQKMHSESDILCNESKYVDVQNHCRQFSHEMTNTQRQIEANRDIIEHYITNNEERRKREIFDGVGRISKYLFGTLDDQDATKIDEQIKNLQDSRVSQLRLIKSQTSVLESVFGALNDTISTSSLKFEFIQNKLNHLANNYSDFNANLQVIKWNSAMDEIHAIEIVLANQLITKQEKIITILDATSRGKLHPFLINPSKMRKELELISSTLENEGIVPMIKLFNEIEFWYSLIEINAWVDKSKIIFKIKIPIFCNKHYMLNKLLAFPFPIKTNSFGLVEINTPFIISDKTHENYRLTNEIMLKQTCIKIRHRYFCKETFPVYPTRLCQTCECSLLFNNTISTTCQKRVLILNQPLWLYLREIDSWMFIFKDQHPIRLICDNRNMRIYTLPPRAIINVPNGCNVHDDGVVIPTLKAVTVKQIKINLIKINKVNFNTSVNHKQLIEKGVTDQPTNVMVHDPLKLKLISKNIEDLKNNEILEQNLEQFKFNQEKHNTIVRCLFSTAGLIIFIIIIAITLIKCKQIKNNNNKKQRQLKENMPNDENKSQNHTSSCSHESNLI